MTTIERALRDVGLSGSTLERNKEIAREIIDRIFVHQEDAAIDELVAEDFVPHTFGPMPPGREGLREGMKRAGSGISDPEFEIHDLIAEGDRVAVRLTTSARHTGTFMGAEPTGKRYSIDEIHIFRLREGQLVEHWHEFDKGTLLAQLQGDSGGNPATDKQSK
jgi:predicted ester cyclase